MAPKLPDNPDLPKHLMGLPMEMLEMICTLQEAEHLPVLRSLNRKFRDAAERPFGLAFFRHRQHVISTWSLAQLLAISAHPTFASYVRIIGLNCVLVPSAEGISVMFGYHARAVEDTHRLQVDIFRSGYFREHLTKILTNLRTYGHGLSVHCISSRPVSHGYGGSTLCADQAVMYEVG